MLPRWQSCSYWTMRWNKKYKSNVDKEVVILPIVIAAAGTALANFAEGAILAASVYLVSRGVRNPLKTKK